ncbi:hypothetical protein LCGC14_0853060 [marine sediment metagenome]|uniref:Uncharacterized protein n=1 Tax=marine sediment metagenome TaxID=412755 RepID=A0A0F9PEG4_9ZZZZ
MEQKKPDNKVLILEPKQMVPSVQQVIDLAPLLVESGLFPGVPNERIKKGEAVAKMLMGAEMGVSAVTSLQLIDVVKGRLRPRSQLIAAMIRGSKRYDYEIEKSDERECIIKFFDHGKLGYTSRFTIDDAKRAGLMKPDGAWFKWPKEMLFARALSAGATKFCPELLGGYQPLEEEGGYDVVDGAVTQEGQPFPSDWTGFFVYAKELGYTREQVHEILGVPTVKAWLDQGKSLADAEQALRAHKAAKERELWGGGSGAPIKTVDRATGEITGSGEVPEPIPGAADEGDAMEPPPEDGQFQDVPPGDASFEALKSATVSPERLELLRVLLKGSFRQDAKGAVKWMSIQAGHDVAHISQLSPEEVERFIEMQEGIRDRKALQTR